MALPVLTVYNDLHIRCRSNLWPNVRPNMYMTFCHMFRFRNKHYKLFIIIPDYVSTLAKKAIDTYFMHRLQFNWVLVYVLNSAWIRRVIVYHYTPLSNTSTSALLWVRGYICISCNSFSSCSSADARETSCSGPMDCKGGKIRVASFALKQEQSLDFVHKQDWCRVRTAFGFIVERWLITSWIIIVSGMACLYQEWNHLWSLKDP